MDASKLIVLVALVLGLLLIKIQGDQEILMFILFGAVILLLFNTEQFTDLEATSNLASMYTETQLNAPSINLPNNGVITGASTWNGNIIIDGNLTVPKTNILTLDKITMQGVETSTQKELHINDTVVANKFQGSFYNKDKTPYKTPEQIVADAALAVRCAPYKNLPSSVAKYTSIPDECK